MELTLDKLIYDRKYNIISNNTIYIMKYFGIYQDNEPLFYDEDNSLIIFDTKKGWSFTDSAETISKRNLYNNRIKKCLYKFITEIGIINNIIEYVGDNYVFSKKNCTI